MERLTVEEFKAKLQTTDDYHLIDFRTPSEFEGGHLENAVNINFLNPSFGVEIDKLEAGKPVFVYCQKAGRSTLAVQKLTDAGFTEVYDMKGGYSAWTEEQK